MYFYLGRIHRRIGDDHGLSSIPPQKKLGVKKKKFIKIISHDSVPKTFIYLSMQHSDPSLPQS